MREREVESKNEKREQTILEWKQEKIKRAKNSCQKKGKRTEKKTRKSK